MTEIKSPQSNIRKYTRGRRYWNQKRITMNRTEPTRFRYWHSFKISSYSGTVQMYSKSLQYGYLVAISGTDPAKICYWDRNQQAVMWITAVKEEDSTDCPIMRKLSIICWQHMQLTIIYLPRTHKSTDWQNYLISLQPTSQKALLKKPPNLNECMIRQHWFACSSKNGTNMQKKGHKDTM